MKSFIVTQILELRRQLLRPIKHSTDASDFEIKAKIKALEDKLIAYESKSN